MLEHMSCDRLWGRKALPTGEAWLRLFFAVVLLFLESSCGAPMQCKRCKGTTYKQGHGDEVVEWATLSDLTAMHRSVLHGRWDTCQAVYSHRHMMPLASSVLTSL